MINEIIYIDNKKIMVNYLKEENLIRLKISNCFNLNELNYLFLFEFFENKKNIECFNLRLANGEIIIINTNLIDYDSMKYLYELEGLGYNHYRNAKMEYDIANEKIIVDIFFEKDYFKNDEIKYNFGIYRLSENQISILKEVVNVKKLIEFGMEEYSILKN